MTKLPRSAGIDHDRSLPRSLGWSIAVVLSAGTFAAFTTPGAKGGTVLQQEAGRAVPVDATEPVAGSSALAPSATATVAAAAAAAAPAPTSGGAVQAAAPAGKASRAATTAAPARAAAAAAPPPAAAPAAQLQPDAGSYPMTISGTSAVDGKASALPGSGSLVVSGSGGDQTVRTTGVPGGLVLTQRANAGGVDLVSFALTAGSKTLTFRPASPLAYVRTTPGASWSWSTRSTDGSVTVSQTASVSGTGSVSVGGVLVPTITVSRTFAVSGAVQGTVRLTSTVSQVDRLPLVQHQVIDVRATVLLLSTRMVSDTTATLTSTRPR